MDFESYSLEMKKKEIHQRMKIEITVGAGLFAGIGLLFLSFLKRFENRFR